MTEKQIRPLVTAWLQGKGYYVAHEVMLYGFCDLVGCKWAPRKGVRIPDMLEIMSVELKINDISGAIYQAVRNRFIVNYSYIAMPLSRCLKMRDSTLGRFERERIGLIGVDERYGVKVFIGGERNNIEYHPDICRRLWNFKVRHRKDFLRIR